MKSQCTNEQTQHATTHRRIKFDVRIDLVTSQDLIKPCDLRCEVGSNGQHLFLLIRLPCYTYCYWFLVSCACHKGLHASYTNGRSNFDKLHTTYIISMCQNISTLIKNVIQCLISRNLYFNISIIEVCNRSTQSQLYSSTIWLTAPPGGMKGPSLSSAINSKLLAGAFAEQTYIVLIHFVTDEIINENIRIIISSVIKYSITML